MLFNSYAFIFAFLPVALCGFFLACRFGAGCGALWLGLASLVFYGMWNPRYVPLLLGSVLFNYLAGRWLAGWPMARQRGRRAVLGSAIACDLGLLGYFKYADFFIDTVNLGTGAGLHPLQVVLPLGISFFTFTQIAYLVDTFRNEVKERNFIHYLLFVTYFPHLIAGPILHHAEMMPQFRLAGVYRFNPEHFTTGVVVFAIGLFKKVILADGVAGFAERLFDAAEAGAQPGLAEAWGGVLAYTFQIYFDFSGYSDMAIGLSWMIGIALPLNFNSPYKATSIIDFWRCWHMTLSRFLRDYLYIPLGGNRHGVARRYANLLATMTIGGLWHGAGWTFIAWGALHGTCLAINHAWRSAAPGLRLPAPLGAVAGWLLTFLVVVLAWVFFRSSSMAGAGRILTGMAGGHGWGPMATAADLPVWLWCGALGAIALGLPNTEAFMRDHLPALARPTGGDRAALPVVFRRSAGWGVVVAMLLAASMINLPQPTSFLYFNF